MRGETFKNCGFLHRPLFQSTPLMRGETCAPPAKRLLPADFNPLPSCEGRPATIKQCIKQKRFQSTPLMRGETRMLCRCLNLHYRFQSTPLMRGETVRSVVSGIYSSNFNPLPSCEGRRFPVRLDFDRRTFQSTPLMRGETPRDMSQFVAMADFNPLPSCEGRQFSF